MKLKINGEYYDVEADSQESLLHVLRDRLNLKGTVNGCTPEKCRDACTVLINGKAQPSCKIPIGSLDGDRIRTIEGISEDHPVKRAWETEGVEECDYCKSSHIMKALSLLSRMLNPYPEDIKEALNTAGCTCGENPRIIRAITKASKSCYDS